MYNVQKIMCKKYLVLLFIVYCLLFIGTSKDVQAQTDYKLLAPLPLSGVGGGETSNTTAGPYIQGIFVLIIAIASGLAVLKIIFGGIKYMSTDAFSGKSEAKSDIEHALWGLGLAIGAYLILFTISPNLVEFNLNIPVQEIRSDTSTSTGIVVVRGPSFGQTWPGDFVERANLGSNITVSKTNCATIGQTNCTSVSGLSQSVTNALKNLAQGCRCTVTVTGGTEYWLHGNNSTEINSNPTDHKPGGRAVDLSLNLSTYIRAQGARTTTSGCSNLGSEKYILSGVTYVNEVSHWHVCV